MELDLLYGEFAESWNGKMHFWDALCGCLYDMDDFKLAPCLMLRLQEVRRRNGSVKVDRETLEKILLSSAPEPPSLDVGLVARFGDNRREKKESDSADSISAIINRDILNNIPFPGPDADSSLHPSCISNKRNSKSDSDEIEFPDEDSPKVIPESPTSASLSPHPKQKQRRKRRLTPKMKAFMQKRTKTSKLPPVWYETGVSIDASEDTSDTSN